MKILLSLIVGLCMAGHAQSLSLSATNVSISSLSLSGLSSVGWLSLGGSYQTNVFFSNLSTGDNDLLAVPTGMKAYVHALTCGITNQSGIAAYVEVKTNGVYYPLNISSTVTTNTAALFGSDLTIVIFDAGETVAINTAANGLNATISAVVFPATIPAKTAKVFTVVAGDNVVYTCPVGKQAVPFLGSMMLPQRTPNLVSINRSGISQTYIYYLVPNGGSTGPGNRLAWRTNLGNNASLGSGYSVLNAGDSVVINCSANTSGQTLLFGPIYEY